MISQLVFKKAFGWTKDENVFEKGLKVKIEPGINVLVGDQGSGKSTLIELIRTWMEPDKIGSDRMNKLLFRKDVREILDVKGKGLRTLRLLALDFEKDTARTSGAFDWGGPIDTVGFLLRGNRISHGEANKMALNMLLGELTQEYQEKGSVKPTLVMLDEPDAALSIASVARLHMMLRSLAKLGCQIIVSAHNPFLLGCFERVFSVKRKQWVTYGDYLFEQVLEAPGAGPSSHFLAAYQPFDKALTSRTEKPDA